jgi:ABC-type multidrug transport system fused ATPase/permease subunit
VLDKGKLSQYDSPKNLIANPGIFKEMCRETGEFDNLVKIADCHSIK